MAWVEMRIVSIYFAAVAAVGSWQLAWLGGGGGGGGGGSGDGDASRRRGGGGPAAAELRWFPLLTAHHRPAHACGRAVVHVEGRERGRAAPRRGRACVRRPLRARQRAQPRGRPAHEANRRRVVHEGGGVGCEEDGHGRRRDNQASSGHGGNLLHGIRRCCGACVYVGRTGARPCAAQLGSRGPAYERVW